MKVALGSFQKDIDDIGKIPVITTILDVISSTTKMGFIAVARVTEDRWITCSARDDLSFGLKPGDELQVKTTLCDEIRESGVAVIIDNVAEHPHFCSHHTPQMYGFQSYISMPIIKKDGSFFGTLCAIDPEPHHLTSPAVTGMFELFSDLISFHLDAVEQQNQMEMAIVERTRELKDNYAELEKMNKELQSFAYISSHDLQEPLRKIQMMSSMIEEKEYNNLSETGKDYFKRIKVSAARMQSLINDLLAFSRAVNSEKKFETSAIDSIVEDVMIDFQDDFDKQNAKVNISAPVSLSVIPFQFRQLIYNLMSNSLKFASPDRPLQINVNYRAANSDDFRNSALNPEMQYAAITFSDNGIGFDEEYSARIFEMFQSLHERSEYEGTGLGLSIVRKIIDNHHGDITVTSAIDSGTHFTILLPHN